MKPVCFKVKGKLPPKKDGANSMWGKRKGTQAKRLIALRKKALAALGGRPPFSKNIHLTLRVHVGAVNDKRAGDLDNFVTGVCDGLMAAHARAKRDATFCDPANTDVCPKKTIAILEDSQVTKIVAEKLFGQGNGRWYEVELQGE